MIMNFKKTPLDHAQDPSEPRILCHLARSLTLEASPVCSACCFNSLFIHYSLNPFQFASVVCKCYIKLLDLPNFVNVYKNQIKLSVSVVSSHRLFCWSAEVLWDSLLSPHACGSWCLGISAVQNPSKSCCGLKWHWGGTTPKEGPEER